MGKEENKGKRLEDIADQLGVGRFGTHLFICTGPDCVNEDAGMEAWNAIKRAVKAHNPDLRNARLYRTKVGCLRICKDGPIAVSYPEGIWFRGVTAETAPDVVEYLQNGARGTHPLEFARGPLPAPSSEEGD